MAKKRTWVFGVTHNELEDMGFERDKFVELTDPVGLRLTASDVRRGVDRAIELGNPDPCGNEAMSVIKRLKSEAAAQRTERQVVSEAGLKSLEMVDDLQGKWNKQFDEITRLEADVKATRKRADNKLSQYAILKNQYDDIKKRHDELESKERGLKESNEQMLKELCVEQKLSDRLEKQRNDIKKRHDHLEIDVKTQKEIAEKITEIAANLEKRYGGYGPKHKQRLSKPQAIIAWLFGI